MSSTSVLVLTQRSDSTADEVVHVLNRRGVPLVRLDLDEIEGAAELTGPRWTGQLRGTLHQARLEDLCGIYYRRPSRPSAPPGVDPGLATWVATERRWGFWGLLAALPRARWLNWPPAVDAAEYKPWQLVEAVTAGLRVPATAITNIPDAATGFATRADPVLYKPFRGRPVTMDGETRLIYATEVTADQCAGPNTRVAPILLQARIDKAFDVRVTCVDGDLFAVSPRWADGTIPLDWRTDHGANIWHHVEVPGEIGSGLRRMLATMGLRYAAADFSVDHDGQWWFLEINPIGQWAWDHPLRDALAQALADALTKETTP